MVAARQCTKAREGLRLEETVQEMFGNSAVAAESYKGGFCSSRTSAEPNGILSVYLPGRSCRSQGQRHVKVRDARSQLLGTAGVMPSHIQLVDTLLHGWWKLLAAAKLFCIHCLQIIRLRLADGSCASRTAVSLYATHD